MDPAAFRASLVRIGFSIPAAAYIVAPTGQGILFTDLVDLTNEDVFTLCSALHCPARGMINDPNAGAGAPQIRNPGIPVPALGILRWAVELGRVDITTEVFMLSSHLALPRDGHLVGALHIFAYLDKKHNAGMVFDPTYPAIDKSVIPAHD
jgi:hypothetical protein